MCATPFEVRIGVDVGISESKFVVSMDRVKDNEVDNPTWKWACPVSINNKELHLIKFGHILELDYFDIEKKLVIVYNDENYDKADKYITAGSGYNRLYVSDDMANIRIVGSTSKISSDAVSRSYANKILQKLTSTKIVDAKPKQDEYIDDYSIVKPGDIVTLDKLFKYTGVQKCVAFSFKDCSSGIFVYLEKHDYFILLNNDNTKGLKIIGHSNITPAEFSSWQDAQSYRDKVFAYVESADEYITDFSKLKPGDIVVLDNYFGCAKEPCLVFESDAYLGSKMSIISKNSGWANLHKTESIQGVKKVSHVDTLPLKPFNYDASRKIADKILKDY